MTNNNNSAPQTWGISDLKALKTWQGQRLELHLTTGKILYGELVGYGLFTLTLKLSDRVAVVNKGAIVWYTVAGQDTDD